MNESGQIQPTPHPCPTCGRCPTCGHTYLASPAPYQAPYPYTVPYWPWSYGPSCTSTTGMVG